MAGFTDSIEGLHVFPVARGHVSFFPNSCSVWVCANIGDPQIVCFSFWCSFFKPTQNRVPILKLSHTHTQTQMSTLCPARALFV